jgi:rubrerythrin
MNMAIDKNQLNELLCQALETEIGGVDVYTTALRCAVNDDLKEEWTKYLDQTQQHELILRGVFEALGLDQEMDTPGRQVVRHIGQSLVRAMELALDSGGPPEAAEIVAAECVVEAETKDHLNWELIGKAADALDTDEADILKEAHAQIEDEEDEHLYHTKGWARELWIASLGLPAVLPPPEEVKKVDTAMGAARAEQSRSKMLGRRRGSH